ncbi:glycoside hydrolase [Paenibacillus alkaliterrae]|uniref:sialidase family protein n=1 Tax=Paenibacillus alkaliterrae TaxID=320909 RepID=UPI001F30AD2A|nr:sialidase family protein [Paenibacillus alkaliterrae]MCF2939050.1 glycoside hydrolase [Paenibacillus alkaliterrae]
MANTIVQVGLADPPALSAVATGAEAKAQAYTLIAPTLASSPLTIKHPDGTAFNWRPTELAYRDATGQMDYLVGSSPSSLSTRGKEARYARTFPNADDIFIAQAGGVKHWTVLHEPPRTPAAYLGAGIEFGVSGLITGIPLPLGSHKEIASDRFNFPEPIAKDLNGKEIKGRYEVKNTASGQQLFIWFPYSFLRTATYPIMLDPTVVINAAYDTSGNGGRKIVRLSNGWLVAVAYGGTGSAARFYRSTDEGVTWAEFTHATGIPGTGSGRNIAIASSGTTVYLLCFGTPATNYDVKFIKFDATTVPNTDRLSSAVVLDTITGYDSISLIIDGTGAIHAVWACKNGTYPNSFNIRYSKSTDIGATWAVPTQITKANNSLEYVQNPSIIFRNGHPIIVTEVKGSGGFINGLCYILAFTTAFTTTSSAWMNASYKDASWGDAIVYQSAAVSHNQNNVIAILKKYGSNVGRIWAVWDGLDATDTTKRNLRVSYSDDGGATWSAAVKATTGNTVDRQKPTVGESTAGDVFAFYQDATSISYQKCSNGTVTFGSVTSFAGSGTNPSAMSEEANVMMGVIYMDASQVKFEKLSFNQAPNAPTLGTRTNFDATSSAAFTWTFSDPDAGNTQSAYQLLIKRVSDGVTVIDTGKVASTTSSHTVAANALTNNVQYQWQVRTWDQGDLVGPYSSLASFWTSAKPTASITTPATDGATVSSSSLTTQWSFSDPESEGQSAYQVKLTSNADAVLWDSGKVADVNARSRTIGYTLVNSTSYKVKVTVWDAKDVASTEVVRTFTTSFTPPATPTIAVTAQNGYIGLAVTNPVPSGSQPTVNSNDLYRRKLGETTWQRIVAGIAVNGSFNDYAAASGQAYEYKATAIGSNGTTADSAAANASITLSGVWLHDVADPGGTFNNFKMDGTGRSSNWQAEASMMKFAGRSGAVAEFGEQEEGSVTAQIQMLRNSIDVEKLNSLVRRKGTLCYRDGRGRKLFGVIITLPFKDEDFGYATTIEVIETSYSETV